MPPYTIEFRPAAARAFRNLPTDVRRRLTKKIDALATVPQPDGVKTLAGGEELYRIRVGDYRLVYQIRAAVLIAAVVRVAHRRDVYR